MIRELPMVLVNEVADRACYEAYLTMLMDLVPVIVPIPDPSQVHASWEQLPLMLKGAWDAAAQAPRPAVPSVSIPVGTSLKEAERLLCLRTLDANGWNRAAAARTLKVSRRHLYNKLKQYGITRGVVEET